MLRPNLKRILERIPGTASFDVREARESEAQEATARAADAECLERFPQFRELGRGYPFGERHAAQCAARFVTQCVRVSNWENLMQYYGLHEDILGLFKYLYAVRSENAADSGMFKSLHLECQWSEEGTSFDGRTTLPYSFARVSRECQIKIIDSGDLVFKCHADRGSAETFIQGPWIGYFAETMFKVAEADVVPYKIKAAAKREEEAKEEQEQRTESARRATEQRVQGERVARTRFP